MSVFQIQDLPKEVQELEMGYEDAYFKKKEALSLGLKIIEGVECNMYQTKIKDVQLTLFKRKDNGNPFQIDIKTKSVAYSVQYINYELNIEPDFSLFEVPQGINIVAVN